MAVTVVEVSITAVAVTEVVVAVIMVVVAVAVVVMAVAVVDVSVVVVRMGGRVQQRAISYQHLLRLPTSKRLSCAFYRHGFIIATAALSNTSFASVATLRRSELKRNSIA